MPLSDIAKLQEIADRLEDALQVSTFTIEQDERGHWPPYDGEWRFGTIILKQGKDGSWPPYSAKLDAHCDLIIERLSYGHSKVKTQQPPYFQHGTHPAQVADYLQRKTAIAMGRQVPLDPEKLDRS